MKLSLRVPSVLAVACLVTATTSGEQQTRDALPPVGGTATIAGIVVTADSPPIPVRRATVTVIGDAANASPRSVLTGDAGEFTFAGLEAGRLALMVSKATYLPAAFGANRAGGRGTRIVVEAGQSISGLTVPLLKGSVLAGDVTDEAGRPVPAATISALRYAFSSQTGERTLQRPLFGSSEATTDDLGGYRLYGLEPGDYVVSASWPPRAGVQTEVYQIVAADVLRAEQLLKQLGTVSTNVLPNESLRASPASKAFAPVFHPSAFTLADAVTLRLGAHEERVGVDIRLRLAAASTVSGVVFGSAGAPAGGVSAIMIPLAAASGVGTTSARTVISDREGRFVMSGTAPGRYTLVGIHRSTPQSAAASEAPHYSWGQTEVVVDAEDITLSLALSDGLVLSGRLLFEGSPALPKDVTATVLVLRSGSAALPPLAAPAVLRPDGTFTFSSVAPGTYGFDVNVSAAAKATGWRLKSVMLEGRDLLDESLEVKANLNIDGIVVQFTEQHTQIAGTVIRANVDDSSEHSLIVFSADPRFRGARNRRTRHVQLDADGRFSIDDLPPGEYLLSAVADVELGQWHDPEFLDELSTHSPVKLTLVEGEKKVVSVRLSGAS